MSVAEKESHITFLFPNNAKINSIFDNNVWMLIVTSLLMHEVWHCDSFYFYKQFNAEIICIVNKKCKLLPFS